MKKIRELIKEVLGVFLPAVKLSKTIAAIVMKEINDEADDIKKYPHLYDFSTIYHSSIDFTDETSIRRINIKYMFYKDKKDKGVNAFGGGYDPDKLNQYSGGE